ncbi:hypothetical protein NDU88_006871 [Pleurodeles waltl]|uniref:Uncharacterized protein n=1 Tax=Pleurodeles waltl TaxID=8319 RepID=A0AAV7VQC4_PLEWA|nr:hypothetical protein NDU88_006871 [Pleurodeles waltl]
MVERVTEIHGAGTACGSQWEGRTAITLEAGRANLSLLVDNALDTKTATKYLCPTPTESSVSPLRSKSVWRPTPIRVPQTGPPSIALAQFVLPVTFGYVRAEAISRSEAAME